MASHISEISEISDMIGVTEFEIRQFQIKDHNIEAFSRLTQTTHDCVPNALCLLGFINSGTADLIRIIVEGQGIVQEKIEKIFNYLTDSKNFRFFPKNEDELYNYCQTELNPGHAIFVGIPYHVFLIAKDLNGLLGILDASYSCILIEGFPPEYTRKERYWVLGNY